MEHMADRVPITRKITKLITLHITQNTAGQDTRDIKTRIDLHITGIGEAYGDAN